MKTGKTGFRALYRKFTAFELTKDLRSSIELFPGAEDATHVVTYGYVDHTAGLSLEVLSAARIEGKSLHLFDGNDTVSSKIRSELVQDCSFYPLEKMDEYLRERFSSKIEMVSHYDAPEEIAKTRTYEFLDPCRHEDYIDDVQVHLIRHGLQTEVCWVRIEGLGERCFKGTLLNQPYQDFGVRSHDEITFNVTETEDHRIICYAIIPSEEG